MNQNFLNHIAQDLVEIKEKGLYKKERSIQSSQQPKIKAENQECLNFCANNYLGLANHPYLIEKAKEALDSYGYGMVLRKRRYNSLQFLL